MIPPRPLSVVEKRWGLSPTRRCIRPRSFSSRDLPARPPKKCRPPPLFSFNISFEHPPFFWGRGAFSHRGLLVSPPPCLSPPWGCGALPHNPRNPSPAPSFGKPLWCQVGRAYDCFLPIPPPLVGFPFSLIAGGFLLVFSAFLFLDNRFDYVFSDSGIKIRWYISIG